MTKPTKWHVRPAKTQISLGIRPVWAESSLSAWRKIGSLAINWAHSEDSDQTGRMPRLIWVFVGRTCHFVGFVMRRLIWVRLRVSPSMPPDVSFSVTGYEPAHAIMVFFVLRKLILQTRMSSHPVELNVWILVRPFFYFYTSCMRTAKALAIMRGCGGSPEPSMVAYVISTIISWPGSYHLNSFFFSHNTMLLL